MRLYYLICLLMANCLQPIFDILMVSLAVVQHWQACRALQHFPRL